MWRPCSSLLLLLQWHRRAPAGGWQFLGSNQRNASRFLAGLRLSPCHLLSPSTLHWPSTVRQGTPSVRKHSTSLRPRMPSAELQRRRHQQPHPWGWHRCLPVPRALRQVLPLHVSPGSVMQRDVCITPHRFLSVQLSISCGWLLSDLTQPNAFPLRSSLTPIPPVPCPHWTCPCDRWWITW